MYKKVEGVKKVYLFYEKFKLSENCCIFFKYEKSLSLS